MPSSGGQTPATGPWRPLVRIGGGLLLLAIGAGCPSPDPEGKYERFNEETKDDRERPEPKLDMGVVADSFPDISGTYLVALDTVASPGLPLQFIGVVDANIGMTTGEGTISVEFQPLSLDQGSSSEPREEVGDALVVESNVEAGNFILDFGVTMVTGAANPLTGADITADIVLTGGIRGMDGWCGSLTGEVSSPIQLDLEGSTFAATRLADRDELPDEFPAVKCTDIVVDEGEDSDGSDPTGGGSGTTGS